MNLVVLYFYTTSLSDCALIYDQPAAAEEEKERGEKKFNSQKCVVIMEN
jgi:hypothetical protein